MDNFENNPRASRQTDRICRICLSVTRDSNLLDIHSDSSTLGKTIAIAIMECAPVTILYGDKRSSDICENCFLKLRHANTFKTTCETSNRELIRNRPEMQEEPFLADDYTEFKERDQNIKNYLAELNNGATVSTVRADKFCSACKVEFADASMHKSHTCIFMCEICKLKHPTLKALEKHKQVMHSNTSRDNRCKNCNETFYSFYDLTRHRCRRYTPIHRPSRWQRDFNAN